jgi:3-oxoacyl-[acyl-carrier-protein] synthase-1
MTLDQLSVVITGMGMRTAVGNTAVQSCASVRAGISRFAEWPYFSAAAGDAESEDEEPSGVVVSAMSDDFGDEPWTEKVFDALIEPLHEALWAAKRYDLLTSRNQSRIGVYLATPCADRLPSARDEAAELGADEEEDELDDILDESDLEAGKVDQDEDAAFDGEDSYEAFRVDVVDFFEDLLGKTAIKLFPLDHASGLIAIAHAINDLERDEVDLCLVAGMDSLLDSQYLAELFERGVLKTEDTSSGLIPGEAAAVLVLEREENAAARGVAPIAKVASVAVGKEIDSLDEQAPPTGRALTQVLRAAVKQAGGPDQFGAVYVDLTGERSRFLEWALVETRCMHVFPRGWRIYHPADCLGDVGAAFGIVATVLAARALQRGYAPSNGVLVCSSSQRGERSAACLFNIP